MLPIKLSTEWSKEPHHSFVSLSYFHFSLNGKKSGIHTKSKHSRHSKAKKGKNLYRHIFVGKWLTLWFWAFAYFKRRKTVEMWHFLVRKRKSGSNKHHTLLTLLHILHATDDFLMLKKTGCEPLCSQSFIEFLANPWLTLKVYKGNKYNKK